MAIRLTESRLRQIIREEASRLVRSRGLSEGHGLPRGMHTGADYGADHLQDPFAIAAEIIKSLGRVEAASLHTDVMAGDHSADMEFQQLITDVSDGMVDLDDPANFGFPDMVLNAMKKALRH